MICLVITVNERDLSLLNHAKHDSYLVHEYTHNITVTGFDFLDMMVMTASSERSLLGTTLGVAGRHDSKTSSFAHECLAQVREKTFPSHHTFMVAELASSIDSVL